MRCGAGGVEIDVRLCRTGEVVVVHDATLERITRGADLRSVASLSYEALRGVRLPHGERVPTLAETLAYCAEKGVLLNVEIKRDVPSRVQATKAAAQIIRDRRAACQVVISSFDPLMLAGMTVLAREASVALLLHPDHAHLAPVARWLRALAIHPARQLCSPAFVGECHARGLRVLPWTVNHLEEARRLLTLGVDGIITDVPGTLRPLFD